MASDYQSPERSVNATPRFPRRAPVPGFVWRLAPFLFLLIYPLPGSALSTGPTAPEVPGPAAPARGAAWTVYRPEWPATEGVLLLEAEGPASLDVLARTLSERGLIAAVVSVPSSAANARRALRGAYGALAGELGERAVVGVVALPGADEIALRWAQSGLTGALLLIGPAGDAAAFVRARSEPILALVADEDFVGLEHARALYREARTRTELWLVDAAGVSWGDMVRRDDVSGDLADWLVRALRERREESSPRVATRQGERDR